MRKLLEEYKAQLRERERRTTALYGALIDFTRTLDTARPLVQDYTRDYGMSRREIGEQFGLTQRQLSALFEPLTDAGATAEDTEPQAPIADATSIGGSSASQLNSMSTASVEPASMQTDYLSDQPQQVYALHC
ncbi:hypothetical protein [Bifidobacterium biavatii]|uniref:hypothetical protein n=1 Tax=Bifidobacterium biavatii TaxID=762212 RepID=UPI0005297164|nr:hypothetical protein [Bifidobacterium biavatii]